jgi:2',3'-cyclic-nucleotide 2'-phosphodiesterase (5'-nucleotidase family)
MRIVSSVMLCLAAACTFAQTQIGPSAVQDAADALRTFAGSDAAFIYQGSVNEKFEKNDLATVLKFPNDEVLVLTLTGTQIMKALERSISLYPQSNQSFLYISGIEAKFSQDAPPNKRIISAVIGGSPVKDTKTYTVAMSSSLARGTLGYFKIWKMSDVTKTISGKTIADALKGKSASASPSHWSAQ